MSLSEPIVEGAYYEREDGQVVGPPAKRRIEGLDVWILDEWCYRDSGAAFSECAPRLTRRVYVVTTDPAEVVAELRAMSARYEPPGDVYGEDAHLRAGHSYAFADAADVVESMLGLARCGEGCDGNCELTAYGPTKAEAELAELKRRIAEMETAAREAVEEMRHRATVLNDLNTAPLKDGYTWAYELSADLVAVKLGVK